MFERMMAYVNSGVRSVEILSKDEYEYLIRKGSEKVTFAESEVTDEIKSQAAKHGMTLNTIPDEQYQAELVKQWLASMSDDTDNKP